MPTANELWQGRSLSANANERRHVRTFQSTDASSQFTALTATGVPTYYSVHPDDSYAYAIEFTVSNPVRESYLVTVNYSTAPQRQVEQNFADPTATPPEWNFDTVDLERVVRHDLQGNATKNSAGDAFEISELEPIHAISVTQVLSEFNLGQQIDFENSVNLDGQWGFSARQLWIKKIRAPLLYRGADVFFRRTIELLGRRKTDNPPAPAVVVNPNNQAVNPLSWDHVELDAGFNHLKPNGNKSTNLIDGVQSQVALRLKGDGSLAGDNDPDRYIAFRIKSERTFNELGMPAALPAGVTVA